MPGHKIPCLYCDRLVSSEAKICPFCGKDSPLSPRCPGCGIPVREDRGICGSCGLALIIECPRCHKHTFFGDYCQQCQIRLVVVCHNPACRAEQRPVGANCAKCGEPLR